MGREKDAARQRRKMQERSAAEVQAFENQRAQQLARKREEQVLKWEKEIKVRDKGEAVKAMERIEHERLHQVKLREEKDRIIEEREKEKAEEHADKEGRRDEFDRLEEHRESAMLKKDMRRAKDEKAHWDELREVEQEEREATEQRQRNTWKDFLLKWKVDASKRAVARRDQEKRNAQRDKKLREREDQRLRKFRETQFLDTMRARSMSPSAGGMDQEGEEADHSRSPSPTSKADKENWSKSFEQQERHRRITERATKRKQEEAKRSKVEKLGATNPNLVEIHRINDWRKQQEKKKQGIEKARLDRALAEEKHAKDLAEAIENRTEKFETLEKSRREASLEREHRRNEAVVQRTRQVPIGTGLPMALVY